MKVQKHWYLRFFGLPELYKWPRWGQRSMGRYFEL